MHTYTNQTPANNPVGPLSRQKVLCHVLWLLGLFSSVSLSEPPLIQCAAHILSQHAVTIAKAWSRPPGAIRKIYPFILQDTHLAKQRPSRGTCQEGYISMWQPFAFLIFCLTGILVSQRQWNLSFWVHTCTWFSVRVADADALFTEKTGQS